MDLADFILVSTVLVGTGLFWMYMKRGSAKQQALHRIWRQFAQLKALREQDRRSVDPATIMYFQGNNRGLPFVMECFVTEGTPMQVGKLELSRGETLKIFTRMRVAIPGLPKGLRVYRKTTWSKLGKAIGMQDIATGDTEFDRFFVVKGDDPQKVGAHLNQSRRMALMSHASLINGLELEDKGLVLLREGQVPTIEELERLFSQLGALAAALT